MTSPFESVQHEDDLARIRWNLSHHAPSDEQIDHISLIRDTAINLGGVICDLVPAGRERSLALTALEDVTMQAVAGIARAVAPEPHQRDGSVGGRSHSTDGSSCWCNPRHERVD